MKVPGFELSQEINDESDPLILSKIMDMLQGVGDQFAGYARLLVKFRDCDPNLFLEKIKIGEKPERLRFTLMGDPEKIIDYNIKEENLKGWETVATISNLEQAKLIPFLPASVNFIIFNLTNDNIDEIEEAYYYIDSLKITPNFANIKVTEGFILTPEREERLIKFFTPLLKKDYWYDEESQQVYNKAANLPIKGFRSLHKYLFKYSYSRAGLTLVGGPDGIFRSFDFRDNAKDFNEASYLSLGDVRQILLNPTTPQDVGFHADKCSSCQLQGACKNDITDPADLFIPSERFCNEALYAAIPLKILQSLPHDAEKEAFFFEHSNRHMA